MTKNILISVFAVMLIITPVITFRALQQQPRPIDAEIKIIEIKPQIVTDPINSLDKENDPFRHGKKGHKKDHNKFERQDSQGIYRPFSDKDDERPPRRTEEQEEEYNKHFNQLLAWGLLLGSIFLSFVLIKTCIRKRGGRMHHRQRQCMQRNQNIVFRQPQVLDQRQQFYPQFPQHNSQHIQDQIKLHEQEIIKLKKIQEQTLKRQFTMKKMEEERKAEFMKLHREQNFQPRRNYGPQFYYAGGQHFNTENAFHQYQHQHQPFVVKGVEPIKRERSNSFKTELSEMPILKNEIKYKNGIPVGKPLKQDHDSSFASDYPEV